ncbi:MAG: tetratricopeptide repeat protein [Bacteroidales bacterium]|nr:tetratricopeptide repeat protein [Bacteroidales bacterium]
MKKQHIHQLILIILIAICYGNTLTLKYALDDRMVILESKHTIDGGWDSIKSIFTEDTFSGYFGNNKSVVGGGRYRPMSQLTFLIEFQLFGKHIREQIGDTSDFDNLHDAKNEQYFNNSFLPYVNHLFNIIYFTLLCLLIYHVLQKLFHKYNGEKWYQSLAFLAAVLFALHPIHTEAVANIKGRDEIFAMLGATAALWCCLKYVDKHQWWYLLLALLAITFGLFSKENAITYLAVVPLSLYYYDNSGKRKADYFVTLLPILLGSIFFVAVRSNALGGIMPEEGVSNILNNPFIHSSKAQEIATVLITWGIYLKLLFFPHPLTHDYYPNQIAITDFSNPLVWIILIGCIALVVYALINLKKKSVIAFGIAFFVITFSITSNLLFNVGTFMNERFVFMASLGFTLIIGYWLYLLSVSQSAALQKVSLGAFALLSILYGIKTFTRNFTWKDDFTLFLTDVKTSDNSIKCNVSAGGSYLQMWKADHKEYNKRQAYKHLNKALSLDNHALNAYLLLGELEFLNDHFDESYNAYHTATLIDPNNKIAVENLQKLAMRKEDDQLKGITNLLDEGMQQRDANKIQEAYNQINNYLKENPESIIAQNIRGNVLGRGFGQLDASIRIYEDIIAKEPNFASAWENMGIAYALKRNFAKAEECLLHALSIVPDNENVKHNLYSMYMDMGDVQKAEAMRATFAQ